MSKFMDPTIVKIDHKDILFTLLEEFDFYLDFEGHRGTLVVPAGFRTDFVTMPRFFRLFWRTAGLQAKAGILHDYLYGHPLDNSLIDQITFKGYKYNSSMPRKLQRDLADHMFYHALRVSGMSRLSSWLMYAAVRLFGARHFDRRRF